MYRPLALIKLTDELGALESEYAPYKSHATRIDAIRKALRAACSAKASDEITHVRGDAYEAFIGACSQVSSVNVPALIEHIGLEAFAAFASASLTAIETHCGADVLASVVGMRPAGPRPISIAKLPAKAPAVAAKKPARKKAA